MTTATFNDNKTVLNMRGVNDQEIGRIFMELERQSKTRRDYLVPAKEVRVIVDNDRKLKMSFPAPVAPDAPVLFDIGPVAHDRLSYRHEIGSYYYRKLETEPELLAHNLNYWNEKSDKTWLLRTLDGRVRTVQSDRYRTLDNSELFFETYKIVKDVNAKIVRVDLTEERFYMQVLHPDFAQRLELQKANLQRRRTQRDTFGHRTPEGFQRFDEDDGGTWLVPGIIISNSEVGKGSLRADFYLRDMVCANGMTTDRTLTQYHIGRQLDDEWLSSETRNLQDAAIWSQVRDIVKSAFTEETVKSIVDKMRAAQETQIINPVEAVDVVVKNNGFDETDRDNILAELMGDPSVYGMISAITAVARDKADYNEGYRMEQAAGKLLEDHRELVLARPRLSAQRRAQSAAKANKASED